MNKMLIALFFVLPAATALAQVAAGRGRPATNPQVNMQGQLDALVGGGSGGPANPAPPTLAPGLHLQVTDGAIVVTNSGGSQGFQAGQFGFVPSVNQPPIIVPNNPGVQFTPPPSFNSGSGGPTASTGSGSNAADCIVR